MGWGEGSPLARGSRDQSRNELAERARESSSAPTSRATTTDEHIARNHRTLTEKAGLLLRRMNGQRFYTPEGLVNEVYVRLRRSKTTHWRTRQHFIATACIAMRHTLIDAARRERGERPNAARDARADHDDPSRVIVAREALVELSRIDERASRIVGYKLFRDLDDREIAALLGVSERTVRRHWAFARMWIERSTR